MDNETKVREINKLKRDRAKGVLSASDYDMLLAAMKVDEATYQAARHDVVNRRVADMLKLSRASGRAMAVLLAVCCAVGLMIGMFGGSDDDAKRIQDRRNLANAAAQVEDQRRAEAARVASIARDSGVRIETDAAIDRYVNAELLRATVAVVRAHGNTCDSVSAFRHWSSTRGMTLKCNIYRYEYELEDHGGKWKMTVKD